MMAAFLSMAEKDGGDSSKVIGKTTTALVDNDDSGTGDFSGHSNQKLLVIMEPKLLPIVFCQR